jgi:hypothetical protein
MLLYLIFYLNICRIGQLCGIYFADSTKLAVCHNRRIHSNKVFTGRSARDKTSTGWFYGLKLFLVINAFGEIMSAFFNYKKRAVEKGATGKKIAQVHHELQQEWNHIQIGEVHSEDKDNGHLFRVQVKLNGLNPANVLVELYADGINGAAPVKIKMKPVADAADSDVREYDAQTDGSRPASDYTPCIVPNYENISVPLEDNLILWQH